MVADGSIINVVSAAAATTLDFTARTAGTSGILAAANWAVTGVAPGNLVATTNTAATTLLNTGTLTIPAGFTGNIGVAVTCGVDPTKVVSFTVYVDTLKNVVAATSAPVGKFIVGGKVWRVLSKNLGSGGNEVLILAEYLQDYGTLWHSHNNTGSTWYQNSDIRNIYLKDYYENNLQWAHPYAVRPSTTPLAWNAPTNETTNVTSSSGVMAGSSGASDACFLLSYADLGGGNWGFPSGTAADAKRIAYVVGSAVSATGTSGTARAWWLRSAQNNAQVWVIGSNGLMNSSTPNMANMAVRPALILDLGL